MTHRTGPGRSQARHGMVAIAGKAGSRQAGNASSGYTGEQHWGGRRSLLERHVQAVAQRRQGLGLSRKRSLPNRFDVR